LWLFSSHRLPHVSELSRPSDSARILRSAAQAGETVLAASRTLLAHEQAPVQGLVDGGPVALDRLSTLSGITDGFVVEVR
jgi:hypothetical protein